MTNTAKPAMIDSAMLQDDRVLIAWSDGEHQTIDVASLRHSPGFPGGQRPAGPAGRFPAGPQPARVSIDDDGLRLLWQPGDLCSLHAFDWLRARLERARDGGNPPPRQLLWDAASIEELPEPKYASLEADEAARLALSEQLLNWGVARIREVPPREGIVGSVAGWFGQPQPNAYADNGQPLIASIRVDPTTPVATRQSHFLGPHTDTCWRQTLAGLLLMHCLEAHPEGGRSMLVDGFNVAARLRAEAPDAFELLATVPIPFEALVSEEDQWRAQGRVISVSADGAIEGIRYNGNSIGDLELPAQLVAPMYAALERFERILYDRELWWRPRLAPGDLLVIDNHRILHGREQFDPAAGKRHLQCASVERDDFHNRYRRLARRRGVPDWDRRLSAGVF